MNDARRQMLEAQHRRAKQLPDFATWRWRNRMFWPRPKPDVSVLITCFNYAAYVGHAMRSAAVAAQQGLTIEIIIVDDASTDGSNKTIRTVARGLPVPVRLLRPWWNVGLSRARNLALARARADFVFILDADNTVAPEALRRLHARMVRENADAAFGPIRRVFADGSTGDLISDRPFDARLLAQGNYIDAMAMFRRQTLLAMGGYDVDLLRLIGGWEDYALWLALGERGGKVTFEPELVGQYLTKLDSMVSQLTPVEQEAAMGHFAQQFPNMFKPG